ncbi:unnamed protein product [Choristocarpus tenellus]
MCCTTRTILNIKIDQLQHSVTGLVCCKCFETFVLKGSNLAHGDTRTCTVHPLSASWEYIEVDIVATHMIEDPYLLDFDESLMKTIGIIRVSLDRSSREQDRSVDVCLTFGGTELKVVCTKHGRPESVLNDTTVDFVETF